MIKKKSQKNRIFLNLNQIFFLFKLDLLFELIIFSNRKIIKFYYKILSLLNFNLLQIISDFKHYRIQNSQINSYE